MKKKLLLLGFILSHFLLIGQEDAWVFFTDKENVSEALSDPITILTQKAIDRKALHGVPIDSRDVPLNETYKNGVAAEPGITVLAKSKWFNAVHVRGSFDDIDALLSLSYVNLIEYANASLNESRNLIPIGDKFQLEDDRVNFNYGDTQNQVEMLNVHLLHQSDYTGDGITVAILDSGFNNVDTNSSFQRLRDNGDLLDGYDFVDREPNIYAFSGNDHGAKVLSTMAGFIEDQFVGTAPDASYYLFRTEDVFSENPVEESYWVEAAERADSLGVDIINTSLGYKNYDNPNYSYSASDMDGQTAFITRGANIASEKGMLLFNSAGNSGSNGVNAPADSPVIMSVGAVDAQGDYVSFSSQGSGIQPSQKPDVMARGAASFVINGNNGVVQNNGTSFSSPIMAGAAACLWQAFPEMTNVQVMNFIREASSQFDMPDFFMGYGIPDFQLALQNGLLVQAEERTEFRVFPNPVENDLQIILPGTIEQADLLIFDVLGKLVYESTILRSDPSVNLSSISTGLYLARLSASGNASKTFKLIKQ